ncbi:hypothetical protein AURDEDRAFT_159191 [Auricularia subglabra TFB-10046 SS5]|nr:hypothetical protein AURDEDRAFT_159191 [Auricularia subglabra TFB-10046 SS5]
MELSAARSSSRDAARPPAQHLARRVHQAIPARSPAGCKMRRPRSTTSRANARKELGGASARLRESGRGFDVVSAVLAVEMSTPRRDAHLREVNDACTRPSAKAHGEHKARQPGDMQIRQTPSTTVEASASVHVQTEDLNSAVAPTAACAADTPPHAPRAPPGAREFETPNERLVTNPRLTEEDVETASKGDCAGDNNRQKGVKDGACSDCFLVTPSVLSRRKMPFCDKRSTLDAHSRWIGGSGQRRFGLAASG